MDHILPPPNSPGSASFSQVLAAPIGAFRRSINRSPSVEIMNVEVAGSEGKKHAISPPVTPVQPGKKKQKKQKQQKKAAEPPPSPPPVPSRPVLSHLSFYSTLYSTLSESDKSLVKMVDNESLTKTTGAYVRPDEREVELWEGLKGGSLYQHLLVTGQIQTILFRSGEAVCKCSGRFSITKGGGGKSQKLTWDRQGWTSHWKSCKKNQFKKPSKKSTESKSTNSGKKGDFGNITRFLVRKEPVSSSSVSSLSSSATITTSPSLLPALPVVVKPKLQACRGVQHEGVKEYATANVKADKRGAFNVNHEQRLRRTLFPYKYSDKVTNPFSPAELLKLTNNRQIHKMSSDAQRSEKIVLTEDEKNYFEEYQRAARKWEVRGERVYSVKCERETLSEDGSCFACQQITSSENGLRSALSRAARNATLDPQEKELKLERSKFVPHSQLIDTLTEANKIRDDPYLRRLQLHPPNSDSAVIEELDRMVKEGKFVDKKFTIEWLRCMIDLTKRKEDKTGNAMKGMRYSERVLEFCVLLRGTGAGSLQRMGLLRGTGFGVPTDRTLYAKMASYNSFKLEEPALCLKNVERAAEKLSELGYTGPLALATDCTKLEPKLQYSNSHAPRDPEDPTRRIGGHVFGALLPWSECYVTNTGELEEMLEMISEKGLLGTSIRLTLLIVPMAGVPPIPISMSPVSKAETSEDIAAHLTQARKFLKEVKLPCISLNSDAAASEVKSKVISIKDPSFSHDQPIVFEHSKLGFKVEVQVRDGVPIFGNLDVEHGRKSLRNVVLSGNRAPVIGSSTIGFPILDLLFRLKGSPLKYGDVFSADKQDDGAARRVFSAQALRTCTVNGEGKEVLEEMNGFFAFAFVFGELGDAWLNRKLEHSHRLKIAARAFFFLLIWKDWILRSKENAASIGVSSAFLTLEANFISSQTFNTQISLINGLFALILIHREQFPNVPLLPDTHSTKACEHEFGNARQSIPDFTHSEFVRIQQHMQTRRGFLANGHWKIVMDQKSKMGYTDTMTQAEHQMSEEELTRAKTFPNDEEIERVVSEGLREANALAQSVGMRSRPLTALKIKDLLEGTAGNENFDNEHFELHRQESFSPSPDTSTPSTFSPDNATSAAERVKHSTNIDKELETLASLSHQPPDRAPFSLQHLLNPLPPSTQESPQDACSPLKSLIKNDGLCISSCIASRETTDFEPSVSSQRNRMPAERSSAVTPLTQNSASALIKSEALDNPLLRKDAPHSNSRMVRWQEHKKKGITVVTEVKIPRIDQLMLEKAVPALEEAKVPLILERGVSKFCPIEIDSIVALALPAVLGGCSIFLGRVLGLFQNGSGRHDCIPSSADLKKLSFVTCEVWKQEPSESYADLYDDFPNGLNEFHHRPGYFVHLPQTKIFYVLYGAKLTVHKKEGFDKSASLNAGKNGWDRFKNILQQEENINLAQEAAREELKKEKQKKREENKEKKKEKEKDSLRK